MNQRGFATLEVILMVMVIGILASIAIPRFDSVKASANTAKIQADLSTIDTAISVAIMEGKDIKAADNLSALSDYLNDYDRIEPPTGYCYIGKKTADKVPEGDYTIGTVGESTVLRAKLGQYTAGDFFKAKE